MRVSLSPCPLNLEHPQTWQSMTHSRSSCAWIPPSSRSPVLNTRLSSSPSSRLPLSLRFLPLSLSHFSLLKLLLHHLLQTWLSRKGSSFFYGCCHSCVPQESELHYSPSRHQMSHSKIHLYSFGGLHSPL